MLAYCHNKYILKVKEGLLTKRYRLALNKNITSAKLFHFDNNQRKFNLSEAVNVNQSPDNVYSNTRNVGK